MDATGHLNGYRVNVIGQRFPNEWMWLAHSTENISLTAVVGYTYWSVSQSHPVHWESSTNHIHSISINQTSGCDWPICELTTTKLPRSLAYFNILNRNVGYWKSDQKSLLKHHRRPKLTSREKANDELMNALRVVWLGVKLREEPLKIWTRYKEYYGERNMVDLQR